MKLVWRILDELWQIFWWMLGIGVTAYVVGETLKGFLGLPLWLKFTLWFAIAVLCKHWRTPSEAIPVRVRFAHRGVPHSQFSG